MPLVTPFAGHLVEPSWAARVVSPLHDALSGEDRRAIMAANPDSYLFVTSDPEDRPGPRSAAAAELNAVAQQRLRGVGAYRPRIDGSCFVYRMVEAGSAHTGVVARVSIDGFVDGRVLGHEAVQSERVEGLVRHFSVVPHRSELVSLVHRDSRRIGELVTAVSWSAAAVLDFTDVSGIRQTVWRADPPTSSELAELLGARPLYIADGHHRVAASVQRWEREGRPPGTSVLCVIYAEEQIRLHAFHRRVRGPIAAEPLIAGLATDFEVLPVSGATQVTGELGLYLDGRWWRLVPRSRPDAPGVAGLDVTLLDERILDPLLGVRRDDPRVEFVPELRDVLVSARECDADHGALFTVHAPAMDDLVSVAERGEVMSAKSTYVQPKPGTGIFLA